MQTSSYLGCHRTGAVGSVKIRLMKQNPAYDEAHDVNVAQMYATAVAVGADADAAAADDDDAQD